MFSCTPDVPCIIPINRQWNNESICNIIWEKVARKLAMVEADLERAEERAEQGEKYVTSPDLNIYCSLFEARFYVPNNENNVETAATT